MEAMEKNIKLDYKKKYKDLYQPKTTGMLIDIAAIPFLMVDGKGNPNEEDGDYSKAMQLLYGITFTIKMSRKGTKALEGYHDYVVPPLEGLWEMKGIKGMDYSRKEDFLWTSMLRLPEYVTEDVDVYKRQQQYRCMGIMAARMCIPGIHTAIAFIQQILHGQSVHIRTQNKNLSTSFFSAYAGKNPGFSDSAVCNANQRQLLLYFCGCLIFLHAWLRMHMKPAAKCNQRLLLFFYPRIYLHTCLL